MKRFLWKALCIMLVLGLAGCQPKNKKSVVNVPSKGLPYELLLVVDDSIWDSEAGDSLKGVLQGSVPGLPQNEPMFRLLRVAPQNYVRNYVTLRNIMFVKVNDSIDNARIGMAYNVEAAPQICMRVDAPDIHSLAQFVGRNKDRIADEFVNSELAQETARLKKKYNKEVDAASREIFGYSVNVPVDLAALKKREQFIWASTDRIDKDMNYVCYTFPIEKNANMLSDYWVAKRDSAMKKNIPGSTPDQWMTTTCEDGMPLVSYRKINFNDRTVYEMRGLWELRNGGIGGPFVSLAFPDTVSGLMVVNEGFIYSPRTNKRDLVRTMEAALRSLKKAQ